MSLVRLGNVGTRVLTGGKLANVGLDGALLSWPRYEEGLTRFIGEILPLVEQAGLRKKFAVEQKQRSA